MDEILRARMDLLVIEKRREDKISGKFSNCQKVIACQNILIIMKLYGRFILVRFKQRRSVVLSVE
jgi:hypothetical protein